MAAVAVAIRGHRLVEVVVHALLCERDDVVIGVGVSNEADVRLTPLFSFVTDSVRTIDELNAISLTPVIGLSVTAAGGDCPALAASVPASAPHAAVMDIDTAAPIRIIDFFKIRFLHLNPR